MSDDGYSKVGKGHAAAMGRLGLRELRGALYTGSNVAQSPELGEFGTQTPGEVAEARRADDRDLEEETPRSSLVDDRLRQAERGHEDRGVESRDLDLDMDR